VDNNVPYIDWPAKSLDLNPIEQLWDQLERRLRSRPQSPTSLTALATILLEEWAAIPPGTLRHLVESLPGRVRAVIKTKSEPIGCYYPRLGSMSQGNSDYSFQWVPGYF
jgi:hypothetical protein